MKIWVLLVVTIFLSSPSHAGKMIFGLDDSLHKLQPVDITGPAGEKLELSYLIQTRFFIAGVYLKDKGYVLSNTDENGSYYPLSDSDINKFQKDGLLPSPMPSYEIGLVEYAIGYSLWLVIVIVALWTYIESVLKRKKMHNKIST